MSTADAQSPEINEASLIEKQPDQSQASKITKSFCALPWIHLDLAPHGVAKTCCLSVAITQDGQPMSVYEHTVEEIWNSQYMQETRKKMLEGRPVEACSLCYRIESEHATSLRKISNNEWLETLGNFDELKIKTVENNYRVEELPVYYQFALGNLCNLSCRMCCSDYSDKISRDEVQSQWSPIVFVPVLSQWENDALLIGPIPVVGIQNEGLQVEYYQGKHFAWIKDKAKIIVPVENIPLSRLEICFTHHVIPGTQFNVLVNDSIFFEGCVTTSPEHTEIDISSLQTNLLKIEILNKQDSESSLGLPIGQIYIHRTKVSKNSGTKSGHRFAMSRFSKDAPWFEQESLIFGEFLSESSNIKKLHFIGGEPSLHKALEDMIDFLGDVGTPENIHIQFNTNGTIYNQNLFNKLKRFKANSVALSVDAFGDKYEYIRYPAQWKTVADNIDKFLELKHIYFNLSPAIQALNVMNITQLMQFCDERDLSCNTNNRVYEPDYLSIFNLPEKALRIAEERLRSYSQSPAYSYNQQQNRVDAGSLADYLANIHPELNFDLLRMFMLFTNDLDFKRGQDFKTTHPELFELITETGFVWTDETCFLTRSQSHKNAQIKTSTSNPSMQTIVEQNVLETEVLRQRIAAMESSKFWKLRKMWFQVRQQLGIAGD